MTSTFASRVVRNQWRFEHSFLNLPLRLSTVASESGCTGISMSVCAEKLHKIEDGDWPSYVDVITEIYRSKNTVRTTPKKFYDHYFWRNNIPHVLDRILGGIQDDIYG